MRSPKAAHLILPLIVAVLGVLLTWQLANRSTIPLALHGEVTSVRSADEHPGHDNAWFVRIGDHTSQVDTEVARLLRVGDRVHKNAWDRTMLLNGRPTNLSYSDDTRAALWFVPLLVLIAAGLSMTVARLSRRVTSGFRTAQ